MERLHSRGEHAMPTIPSSALLASWRSGLADGSIVPDLSVEPVAGKLEAGASCPQWHRSRSAPKGDVIRR